MVLSTFQLCLVKATQQSCDTYRHIAPLLTLTSIQNQNITTSHQTVLPWAKTSGRKGALFFSHIPLTKGARQISRCSLWFLHGAGKRHLCGQVREDWRATNLIPRRSEVAFHVAFLSDLFRVSTLHSRLDSDGGVGGLVGAVDGKGLHREVVGVPTVKGGKCSALCHPTRCAKTDAQISELGTSVPLPTGSSTKGGITNDLVV